MLLFVLKINLILKGNDPIGIILSDFINSKNLRFKIRFVYLLLFVGYKWLIFFAKIQAELF